MGFKRKNYRSKKYDNNKKYNNNSKKHKKKGGSRPKLAIIGAIVLVIGILLVHYGVTNKEQFIPMEDNPLLTVGTIAIPAGVVMLLFSLSKRNQIRLAKGMEAASETFKNQCNCCECRNCGRDHDHWTHRRERYDDW